MSTKISYQIIGYDDAASCYIVEYMYEGRSFRCSVAPVMVDGAVDEAATKLAIEQTIRTIHKDPIVPSNVASLLGATGTATTGVEEI